MAAIAKFTNGKLCEEYAADVKFGLFESTKASKRRKLVAETDSMTYTGHNTSDSISAPFYKYMLAVRDKDSGKIEVFNTDVFHMKPYWPDEEVDKDSSKKSNLNWMDQRDLLTSEFGSKKKVRAMKSRLRNRIATDVLEQALTTAADTALNTTATDVTDVMNKMQDEHASSLLPPYDIDAKSPDKVYNIDDIISASEQAALENACIPFMECTQQQITEWETNKTYSEYVLAHLRTLPIEEKARKSKASVLTYTQYMMQLYCLKVANLKRKDPFGGSAMPTTVKRKMLNTYTVVIDGKLCIPPRLKDKLAINIIVLCLFIDQYTMDIPLLQRALKMGEMRLIEFCLALGCKYTSRKVKTEHGSKSIKSVKLTVPLQFKTNNYRKPLSMSKSAQYNTVGHNEHDTPNTQVKDV